jgi:phosphoglycolate phosphatase-like HAD superfamily hydrolase
VGGVASLLLFDIDGTLVRGATDAHRDALHAALRDVHGVDVTRMRLNVSPAGRTDGEIARILLLDSGVSADRIDAGADDVREACCREYARLVPGDLSEFLLPGVVELLSSLDARDDLRLALVTGNYEPVARLKLGAAGIGGFFARGQGGFGSDAEDRVSLPPIARRRAGTTGKPFRRERTLVIGDTPRDIACAHADGVRCVAVATGPFGLDDLADADVAVSDAAGLSAALERALEI